jgi:3-methyladenine DNA glycosylase AlkC
MKTRVNNKNRYLIKAYIINELNKIVKKKKKNFISLIDKWDVEIKAEEKFNITDYMSQKLTLEILEKGGANV